MSDYLLDFQIPYARSYIDIVRSSLEGEGYMGLDVLFGYGNLDLFLMGLITLVCMGFSGISYICVAYQNRYCEPIKMCLLCTHSRDFTTLGLCSASANVMYKQCLDHKVSYTMRSKVL